MQHEGWVDGDDPFVQLAQQVAQDALGFTPQPVGNPGSNDGSQFKRSQHDFTCLVVGPGGVSAHMANEWLSLPVFNQAIKLYQALATAYCQQPT